MIYLQLFWEFLKIGLFAVGGGMATLPFLQRLADSTGWYSQALITDMIAISESTPGPIGINMATYVGCNVAGFFGGVVATMGEILPSIVIVVLVSKSLERFRGSKLVDAAFYGLRPAVTGLIAAAGLSVIKVSMFHFDLYEKTGALLDAIDFKKIIFFALAFVAIKKFKLHPIVYIACAAVIGLMLSF
ncbi:chromate transporter [Oscillibacter sp.]|uniref:chromate transporter n=1 Tax=Oscillibacter sp. TaxID=1945593 RepID=UPI002604D609|nr:chromate transporter [Oscillibacter sp.]MDD3347187.1 chromate transporter [Oscillibacter sp.]